MYFLINESGFKLPIITFIPWIIISLFSKFLEILKPGGYVCIVDLYKDAPMFSIGGHKHHHVMPHKGFIPEDLCEELKKAGFVNTQIKEVSSINFKGADGKDIISKRFMIIAQGP